MSEIIGTGVKTETTIGDTRDMSASGWGRENFNNTIGIPENKQQTCLHALLVYCSKYRSVNNFATFLIISVCDLIKKGWV